MNIHPTTSKNQVEDVKARTNKTKLEIEQIQSELNKLLNLGIQPNHPKTSPEVTKPLIKTVEKRIVAPPQPPKRTTPPEPEKCPLKKNKNYDVSEARNYIKKQKEKRAEQLKAQINVADNQVDLKKQKLKELHQKTLELVSKSVQLKRERSKSRDKGAPIRPDKSNTRQKQENVNKVQKPLSKSQERQKELVPTITRAKSQERSKPQQTERVARPRTRQQPPQKATTPTLLRPPEIRLQPPEDTTLSPKEKRVKKVTTKVSLLPAEQVSPIKEEKKVLEHSIMTDACVKDTKETQTNRDNNFTGVAWFEPPPAVPHPYNFINAVKRKLQDAINSPRSCVDVGVQNSSGERTPERVKSKEEIKETLINSVGRGMSSFASHKCLDLKAVQNLELIPHNNTHVKSNKDMVSKKLYSYYDSESDTSKNSPDISSESLGATDSKLQLNFDKVESLKLQKMKSSQNSPKAYSSCFQKESAKSVFACFSEDTEEISKLKEAMSHLQNKLRGDGDSQMSFVSYLTEGKPKDDSISEIPASDSIKESLALEEPDLSLHVGSLNSSKDIMNRAFIRHVDKSSFNSRNDVMNTVERIADLERNSKSLPDDLISERLESGFKSSDNVFSGHSNKSFDLKEPDVSKSDATERSERLKSQVKNITIRPSVSNNNVNEIHLKFEAEVRLLNDFHQSCNKFMAAEKAYESIKSKNETNTSTTRILQNVDTQTSVVTKTSTKSSTNITTEKSSRNSRNSINYSRGDDNCEDLNGSVVSSRYSLQNTSFSTNWGLSNLNDSSITNLSIAEEERSNLSIANMEENHNGKNCASVLSLNVFDQLIKEEDTRIQHLKAVIKIREQALLDRTKGKLELLEFQKKQLIETGKIEEVSLLKKKQRGIILKHEQERNEIKKLKQMQKEESEKRKNSLKQQRNLIKSQLSTENMLARTIVKKRKERRSLGPLKVMPSCSDSIHSETSLSRKSSDCDDVRSIVSKESDVESTRVPKEEEVTYAKRTLLMREADLQRRREAVEELLQWHQKLLDEERKIADLEAAATFVIKKPTEGKESSEKYKFTGKQLNQLWKNMTGIDEKNFIEEKHYVMSQIALERLCKSARQYSNKNKKTLAKNSKFSTENSVISEAERSAKKSSDDVNYSSIFEPDSVHEIINSQEEKTKISSISELINSFSKIEDEISVLSRKSEGIVKSSQSVIKTMTPNYISEEVGKESEKEEERESSSIKEIEEEEPSIVELLEREDEHETESKEQKTPDDANSIIIEDQEIQGFEKSPESQISTITDQKGPISAQLPEKDISTSIEETEISKPIDGDSISVKDSTENIVESADDIQIPTKEVSHINDIVKQSSDKSQITTELEDLNVSNKVIEVEEPEEATTKSIELDVTSKSLDLESDSKAEVEDSIKSNKSSEIEEHEEISEATTESRKTEVSLNLEEASKSSRSKLEDLDKSNKPTETVEHEEVSEVTTESKETEVSSKDLSLEEALESASKIEESLSKLNEKLTTEPNYESEPSAAKEAHSIEEASSRTPPTSETSTCTSLESEEITPQKKHLNQIDVKKRVSEILADASPNRDKSPRLQDLYVTAYDVGASNLNEFTENVEEGRQLPTDIFGSEAEVLWRKQLAIEQEIKQLELQQKEQIPFVFMREIPNKPPPPYTPPSSLSSLSLSVVPSDVKEISEVASYSSKVLYKAYQNDAFDKVKFSENGFKLFSKIEVSKMCAEFVFNICKDLAREHYKQFEVIETPSWLTLAKKPQMAKTKPPNAAGLEKILTTKLQELFGFKKVQVAESAIIKWGRKKRDHVDEVLVLESQEEESQWTNFDQDELIVKNQVTNDIMKMLLEETAHVFAKILSKRKSVLG